MAMESLMAVVPYLNPAIENLKSLLKNEVALLWGQGSSSASLKRKVLSYLPTTYASPNILFRNNIGNRINEITDKFDVIAANRSKFHLNERVVVEKRVEYDVSRETSSFITQPQLYGRDEDRDKLVKFLVEDDECEMIEFNSSSNISNEKVHHVTLVVGRGDNFNNTFHKVVTIRTLRLKYPPTISFEDDEFLCDFSKFGSLRAFDTGDREMHELPSSIGNLKHLRYLNLYHTLINQLPDSICSLFNLQTLILEFCFKLERLPQNMMYLRSLRHLYLLHCPLIDEMPPKIGQLTNLKTLNTFVVGKSTACSLLAELKCLNLGGEIRIEHLKRVSNPMDAKEANLVAKQNLTHDEETVCFPKEFLRNLTLLESLSILGWGELKVLPEDLANLVTLKSLKIKGCRKLESLPEEGIRGLESLQSLDIMDCPRIASLPASIQSLNKLQRIQIMFCGRELLRRCEKGQGEDWHKIAHIPEVSISQVLPCPWVMMAAASIEVAVASAEVI
ncbi:hypothetical protein TEA_021078 [Camellia sinensis var. sinensis]|uniref:Disease resistance R13L4/SHOC-2-like LRR domain-containing protein n=1 Tax=Camellia sinensis var. sinensis TaxID=542762 RepID=A0A4S4DYT7_CAMSN|nr:hypothetical protein TEA_021078 [Camellia sinensis var. sinensis]